MGLITETPINNGDPQDAVPVQNNFSVIFSEFNGNIDNNNIKPGGVAAANVKAESWTVHTSTIAGFVTPIQSNHYYVIGKTLFYKFDIGGTSNTTAMTFTIPFAAKESTRYGGYFVTDGGVDQTVPGAIATAASGTTISTFKDMTGTAWTNTGAKAIRGMLICELA